MIWSSFSGDGDASAPVRHHTNAIEAATRVATWLATLCNVAKQGLALGHLEIAKPRRPIPSQRAADADGMGLSRHVDLDLIGLPLVGPDGASDHRHVGSGQPPYGACRRFR